MSELAFWECLYTAGHDAAVLEPAGVGWLLHGTAVFRHDDGPAQVSYAVEIDADWRSRRGHVQGWLGGQRFDHVIERRDDGWHLDGRHQQGLAHLVDLDFGFTPATNLQQLRRVALWPGQAADIPVAWFDLQETRLVELPQHYACLDATSYRYATPQGPYQAVLEIAPNGFCSLYPELWRMAEMKNAGA